MDPIIETNTQKAQIHLIADLVKDSDVIKLYGNGFQCGVTLGDANIVIKNSEIPVALISMSLPAFKSLRDSMNTIIESYSKNTLNQILSFDEIKTNMPIKK